ncbi:CYFA0S07e02960g1_1 [Cyberlindnera fabianii]|uniref:CYFA0S07e02960g1_1 n=1 Tax=Cyberlindnera fabianii TaxID=36022 RepID=A0A061AV78_CYBFA|nr:CYFA0S07e02960g1_1 [Cyberlindnera fabianii]
MLRLYGLEVLGRKVDVTLRSRNFSLKRCLLPAFSVGCLVLVVSSHIVMHLPQLLALALVTPALAATRLTLRGPATGRMPTRFHKRSDSLSSATLEGHYTYQVMAKIGTPPQDVRMNVKFTSGDIFVSSATTPNDGIDKDFLFNETASSTWGFNETYTEWNTADTYLGFYGTYQDDRSGRYGNDTFRWNNYTVNEMKMAWGNGSESYLGLGPNWMQDSSTGHNFAYEYPTFAQRLVENGDIGNATMSLYFEEATSGELTVLLGGIDSNKFFGELYTVPLVEAGQTDVSITLSNIGFIINGEETTTHRIADKYPVQVNYDETGSRLPFEVYNQLMTLLNATWSETYHEYSIDCPSTNLEAYNTSLVLDFQGKPIQVPVAYLIDYQQDGQCFLDLAPDDGLSYLIFGTSMLKSMYMLFDYENKEVSIAQARYTTDKDIEQMDNVHARSAPDYHNTYVYTTKTKTVKKDEITLATEITDPTQLGMTGNSESSYSFSIVSEVESYYEWVSTNGSIFGRPYWNVSNTSSSNGANVATATSVPIVAYCALFYVGALLL